MHLAKPGMMMLAGDASARLSSTDDGTLLFWLEDLTEHRRDWVPPQVRYVARRIHGVVDGVARISVAFLAVTLVGSSLIGVSLMLPTLPFFLDSIIQGLVISAASLMIGIPFLFSFLGLFGILASFGANILLGLIVSPIMIWAYYKVGLALMTLFNRVAPWFGALTDLGERAVGELDDEVLFTQLARANRGRVTLGDLIILYGWPRDEAFKQATRLVVDYDGDIEVEDDGQIVLLFHSLANDATTRPPPIWERVHSPRENLGQRGRRASLYVLAFWLMSTIGIIAQNAWFLGIPGLAHTLEAEVAMHDLHIVRAVVFGLIVTIPIYVVLRELVVLWRTRQFAARQRGLHTLRDLVAQGGKFRAHPDAVDRVSIAAYAGEIELTDETDAAVDVHFPELTAVADQWSGSQR